MPSSLIRQAIKNSKILCFTLVLLLAGLCFLIFTPPFQGPDESNHFLRVYQISKGQILGSVSLPHAGGELPVLVAQEVNETNATMRFHSEVKTSFDQLKAQLEKSTILNEATENQSGFTIFSNTVRYAPIPYVPQVIAVWLSRQLHLSVLYSLYFARLLNLFTAVLILFICLKVLEFSPRYQLIYFWFSTIPMATFIDGTASADVMTNGLGVLSIALGIRLLHQWNERVFRALICVSFMLAFCKSLYFIVPFFVVPFLPGTRNKIILLLSGFLPVIFWLYFTRKLQVPLRTDCVNDPRAQLLFFLKEPWWNLLEILKGAKKDLSFYLWTFFGDFGYVDTPLPRGIINSMAIITIVMPLAAEKHREPRSTINPLSLGGVSVLLCLAIIVSLFIAMYLTWTPLYSLHIEGIQGRYLFPFIPLLFISFPAFFHLSSRAFKAFSYVLVVALIYFNIYSVFFLIHRYWT